MSPAARVGTDASTGSQARLSPASYGVGARLSVYPMTHGFVDLILDALTGSPRPRGLEVTTDDVSTFIRGTEEDVARYVLEVVSRVAASGHHVGGHLMLSRGCPGEVSCSAELGGRPWSPASAPHLPATGHHVAAHWSLYPLLDAGLPHEPDLAGDHMSVIEEAIARAGADGTVTGGGHFVTRLEGDLGDVLGTVVGAWIAAGRRVQHVVTHLTFSLNGSTAPARSGAP